MSARDTSSEMSHDGTYLERLTCALECIETGQPLDLERLCQGNRQHIEDIQSALRQREELEPLRQRAEVFDPLIGQELAGRYEMRSRLGVGGIGIVYDSWDRELNRTVAIKMLRPGLALENELTERLAREAKVLASLAHPGIVTVHDRGRTGTGQLFFVMEKIVGISGQALLERASEHAPSTRGIPRDTSWLRAILGADAVLDQSYVRHVVRAIADIAHVLHRVHDAGIIHRDVKPSNLFLRNNGQPVLLDFGLVTLSAEETLAQVGRSIGTPAYMPPEQLEESRSIDARSDVYSLTATLYHFLTLRRPYAGTPEQVLAALQRRSPQPARRLQPGLPKDLQAILDRGMARYPQDRYESATAFARDLDAWLSFEPIEARYRPAPLRFFHQVRRRTSFQIACLLLILLGVALSLATWMEHREHRRSLKYSSLARHVPVLLLRPEHLRKIHDESVRTRLGETLDAMIDFADDERVARTLKAGFLLDQGKRVAAAKEMARLAERNPSAVVRDLATWYARTASGSERPSLEHDVTSADEVDRFLVAFHLIRSRRHHEALSLLEDSSKKSFGGFDLKLYADLVLAGGKKEHANLAFRRVYRDALAVEAARGHSSAITQFVKGASLLGQQRPADAELFCRAARDLAPMDYGTWLNVGGALLELQEFPQARIALSRALALQPSSFRVRELLIRTLLTHPERNLADLARGKQLLADYAAASDTSERKKKLLRATMAIFEHNLRTVHDPAFKETIEAEKLLAEAVTGFREAGRSFDALCAFQAMKGARDNQLFSQLVHVGMKQLSWRRLELIAEFMPETLTPADRYQLKALLKATAEHMAPRRSPRFLARQPQPQPQPQR